MYSLLIIDLQSQKAVQFLGGFRMGIVQPFRNHIGKCFILPLIVLLTTPTTHVVGFFTAAPHMRTGKPIVDVRDFRIQEVLVAARGATSPFGVAAVGGSLCLKK